MKFIRSTSVLFLLLNFAACQQNQDHEHDDAATSPNQSLYEEVMGIHDDVMPKMNDLYKAKTRLQTRLAAPGVGDAERQEVTLAIARIDSASEGMMVWMRQFDPIPDSVGEDKARAYLQEELVKVKKVREDILEALKMAE